jgi:hypothetical protein
MIAYAFDCVCIPPPANELHPAGMPLHPIEDVSFGQPSCL